MNDHRFDRLARTLARPASRRDALHGAGGLAAATIGGGLLPRLATAQEATPSAAPPTDEFGGADNTFFMFVQVAEGGTWTPKAGADGVFTLTLAHPTAQTIYFSDRPERIVGTVPTQTFLDGLGFTPANPPNGALVAETEAGEDVLVMELLNPTFDAATGQLTYEARVLGGGEASAGLAYLAAQQADTELASAFGPASLFIDDCPDANPLECYDHNYNVVGDLGRHGMCWSWSAFQCQPCHGGWSGTATQCNETFSACHDACTTEPPAAI